MDAAQRGEIIRALEHDIRGYDLQTAPMLAHYTTLATLEKIVQTDELWFSHPLLMNDHEEVRVGILEGSRAIELDPSLRANLSPPQHGVFMQSFLGAVSAYGLTHLFDTYVFCLSEFDATNDDGRLSMWRGYGGDGAGAAIVFDPKQTNRLEQSPLIIDRVEYRTPAGRQQWFAQFLVVINAAVKHYAFTDDDLRELGVLAFERLKMAAIFSKHQGFEEEREWRAVYMPERDHSNAYHGFFGYLNGPRGMEPKLKFEVKPIAGMTADDLSLEKLIERIVLGPNRTSVLAVAATHRMLTNLGKHALAGRLRASGIPFRSDRR